MSEAPKVYSEFVRNETLSVEKDSYLDSHRFGKTPYFPFVMGMEYFCDTIDIKSDAVLFSDYSIEAPLMLRRDRDKDISIVARPQNGNVYKLEIADDKQVLHISGTLEVRNHTRTLDRNAVELTDDIVKAISNDIYDEVLPHGPHFHNCFDIVSIDPNELKARQFDFNNSLQYVGDRSIDDLKLNPAMLDGLLQLCALHSIKFEKKYMLPMSVKKCFINLKKVAVTDVAFVLCKKIADYTYDIIVADDSSSIIVELRGMKFSPLNREVPEVF